MVAVVVAAGLAGCGSEVGSTAGDSTESLALPGTSVVPPLTSNDDLVAAIKPVRVTSPCPKSTSGPDGSTEMGTELAKLEPMLGQVLAYGGQHNTEFGSYGLVWQGINDASVFISFTANIDKHRAALAKIVAHPDELAVCQAAVSGDTARALMAFLIKQFEGRYMSVGLGADSGVEVVLAPGEQALSAELSERYGDAVAVSVCPRAEDCTATAG